MYRTREFRFDTQDFSVAFREVLGVSSKLRTTAFTAWPRTRDGMYHIAASWSLDGTRRVTLM